MTILVPALAAILSVLVAESVWRFSIMRTSAARSTAYVIGLVFATAVASWLVAALVVSLTGGGSEARDVHIFEGTMIEVVCATLSLVALRWGVAAGGAAWRAKHPFSKAGLTALALILDVAALAAGLMAFLAWFGANNW